MQLSKEFQKQILVVEDEGLIAADIQKRLERLGYGVPTLASSGEEALQAARSTPFDLALMDIHLKGSLDGIATAQALRTELQTPVVYLTAHSDPETIERAKLTEPLGYLLKPITDGDLRSVVQISLYRHDMERRIRTCEAWLFTTLRSVGEGILATDPEGGIAFLNPVAEQLTGWPGDEARGRPLMEVLGLCDEPGGEWSTNPIVELLPNERRTYTLVSRAGTRAAVEVTCFENRAERELLGAIVVVRDIRARRECEVRLIQSQRMEAIAGMAGVLAHDFNNQLMVITGYAEELSARLSGEYQEQALEIRQAASVAATTTAQLLSLSRRDVVRTEVIDVNQVIADVRPMICHTLGKGRTLSTGLSPIHGFVRGDRNQIEQVLLNLTLHARDAMPAGGECRMQSSLLEVEADTPQAQLYRPGSYVRLRVSDSGEGMDKATLSRIFEPLFGGKPAFAKGLGLSIVHSIISRAGGYIHAESEIGRGTTFEVLLPCVGTFVVPRETSGDTPPTVLLVEDEDRVRRLMHRYLAREGYRLLEARNAGEAADLAAAYPAPIHVLVTDVSMPGMTGPELAERLAPLHPGMKVLFVSGYRHHTLEHEGLWKNGLNLLPKPFPASELVRRVQLLLRAGELAPQ